MLRQSTSTKLPDIDLYAQIILQEINNSRLLAQCYLIPTELPLTTTARTADQHSYNRGLKPLDLYNKRRI